MPSINEHIYPGATLAVRIGPVGQARVEEVLGTGRSGFIVRISDEATQRLYSLKVVYDVDSCNPEVRKLRIAKRIQREAEINIRSKYIIRALGSRLWNETTHLLLFEFFEGQPLEDLIKTRHLPDEAKKGILFQVMQGVADAHRHNVIHCDLKPDNILVNSEGKVKVIDFGLSKFAEHRITTGNVSMGSMKYLAPEVLIDGAAIADARSDIYSLGHIFYQLAMGKHFWDHRGWRGLTDFTDYLSKAPTPEAAVEFSHFACAFSPRAQTIIHRMTRIHPGERYPVIDEILNELGVEEAAPPPQIQRRLPNPVLMVESGANIAAAFVVSLTEGEATKLGRNSISYLDTSISRNHLEIKREQNRYFVQDLASKNGTWLRGQRLEPDQWVEIKAGDSLRIGEVYLRFS